MLQRERLKHGICEFDFDILVLCVRVCKTCVCVYSYLAWLTRIDGNLSYLTTRKKTICKALSGELKIIRETE